MNGNRSRPNFLKIMNEIYIGTTSPEEAKIKWFKLMKQHGIAYDLREIGLKNKF